MIEVILKGIYVSNEPMSETNFYVSAIIDIGLKGEEGADQFFANIASPEGLLDRWKNDRNIVLRGLILLQKYDLKEAERLVNDVLTSCKRDTWKKTALALNRFFVWDFDDYRLDNDEIDPEYTD